MKKTYIEAAKQNIMVEIRADDGTQLQQGDYVHIADKLSDLLCDIERKPDDWRIDSSGNSMGAIWYACKNEQTKDNIKTMMKDVMPPEPATFKYCCYGPGEEPYIYPKLRIPAMWVMLTPLDLERRLRRVNQEIDQEVELPDGTKQKRVFRVLGKCDIQGERRNDKGELIGLFTVKLQVDECLFEGLKKLGGHLALGPHTCAIVGKEGYRIFEEIEEDELKKTDNEESKGGEAEEKMEEN